MARGPEQTAISEVLTFSRIEQVLDIPIWREEFAQMSSPLRRPNESIGSGTAKQVARSGSQLPAAHELSAAGARNEPPQQYSQAQVFGLLVGALESFPADRRPHPAAGVGARMRRIDPNFTQAASGFSTFREVLTAAAEAGYVRVESADGRGDIRIDLAPNAPTTPVTYAKRHLARVSDDVWKAILTWDGGKSYAFNRETRSPEVAATPPRDARLVLPKISREQQLIWMREFADAEEDLAVREALLTGLAESEPIKGFSAAMREQAGVDRRWKKHLRTRVLERATEWARSANVPLEELEDAPRGRRPSVTQMTGAGETDARERILAILAHLPTSELLRIPIPVEYALKQ